MYPINEKTKLKYYEHRNHINSVAFDFDEKCKNPDIINVVYIAFGCAANIRTKRTQSLTSSNHQQCPPAITGLIAKFESIGTPYEVKLILIDPLLTEAPYVVQSTSIEKAEIGICEPEWIQIDKSDWVCNHTTVHAFKCYCNFIDGENINEECKDGNIMLNVNDFICHFIKKSMECPNVLIAMEIFDGSQLPAETFRLKYIGCDKQVLFNITNGSLSGCFPKLDDEKSTLIAIPNEKGTFEWFNTQYQFERAIILFQRYNLSVDGPGMQKLLGIGIGVRLSIMKHFFALFRGLVVGLKPIGISYSKFEFAQFDQLFSSIRGGNTLLYACKKYCSNIDELIHYPITEGRTIEPTTLWKWKVYMGLSCIFPMIIYDYLYSMLDIFPKDAEVNAVFGKIMNMLSITGNFEDDVPRVIELYRSNPKSAGDRINEVAKFVENVCIDIAFRKMRIVVIL
jgi:hypothetical protein